MNGLKPNSLGLYLDIDYANDYLRQMFADVSSDEFSAEHDTTWLLNDLKAALVHKHAETFWVKAEASISNSKESFHYVEVEHTANPMISRFETLVETGFVTLDYTMHERETGGVRDHGYLFKLKSGHLEALFPAPSNYILSE
jgi:hypothetical protein